MVTQQNEGIQVNYKVIHSLIQTIPMEAKTMARKEYVRCAYTRSRFAASMPRPVALRIPSAMKNTYCSHVNNTNRHGKLDRGRAETAVSVMRL